MTESANDLIRAIKDTVDHIPFGEDKILPTEYDQRVRAVGEVDFLSEVFRQFADSQLSTWMFRLARYWKDTTYQTWKCVLRNLSGDRNLIYQFVGIASEFLALDVTKMAASDFELDHVARELSTFPYPRKLPSAGSQWFQEMCDSFGIDNWAIWTRLAGEGAPMNIVISSRNPGQ